MMILKKVMLACLCAFLMCEPGFAMSDDDDEERYRISRRIRERSFLEGWFNKTVTVASFVGSLTAFADPYLNPNACRIKSRTVGVGFLAFSCFTAYVGRDL